MTKRLLRFTLGPVQGFVAPARRTRDLWAGSFLLSWLAGQAMKAVIERGGMILVPDVRRDALFQAIMNGVGSHGPAVGSLPNRFKAKVSETFDSAVCRSAVDEAWRRVADAVRQRFVASVAGPGHDTGDIWNRQIKSFWEMAWVIGADPGKGRDDAWLDRRKYWRTHRPPVEGGDHCMLMGDWQELSGFVRSRERSEQDAFWQALKSRVDADNPLNLDENERLCAMALIKRLFPHVAKEVLGWTPSWDGQQPLRWPSTPRLAATGWLRHAWEKTPAEAGAFVEIAKDMKGGLMEPVLDQCNLLSQVPGALLYHSGIENARPDELVSDKGDAEEARHRLLKAYEALTNKAGKPSPFYALLLMDGDKLGVLLREKEGAVTTGLASFSSQVDATIRHRGGNTIYAGGDDVLALLPLEGALPAALALRQVYRGAFPDMPGATISAAVVFAHFHVPLRQVLREAHKQLDEAAKEGNGRDSLAVCVLTQSGVTREWVSNWGSDLVSPPRIMVDAARDIDEKTSGRFFYAIREQYAELIAANILDPEDIKRVFLAEYKRSDAGAGQTPNDVVKHIDRLFALAGRHAVLGSPRAKSEPSVSMDGPLIARFLARETRR